MSTQSREHVTSPSTLAAMRRLADVAPVVMWMTDPEGRFTYLNPGIAATLSGDATLRDWLRFTHADDVERMRTLYRAALESRTEYQTEYRMVRSDGSVRWILGCGAPRLSAEGELLGFCGALVDVTARQQALQALEKSEGAYRLLAEATSDLISHHELTNGQFMYVSPACRQLLGLPPDDLLGTSLYDRVHPLDQKTVREEMIRQVPGAEPGKTIEFRIRHAQGHYVWLGTKAQVLYDPSGRVGIGTVAVSREITAERAAREALRKREEQFRSLTALSSDWYWETDEQGRFTFVSDSVERYVGLKPEQLLGTTHMMDSTSPDQPALMEYRAKVAARLPFRNLIFTASPGGAVRHASLSGEPRYEYGRFAGYRGVGRDITNEIEHARERARLAEENKALIDNSLDLMAMLDAQGNILRVNAAITDLLGYTPQEVLGKRYTMLIDPEDEAEADADLFSERDGDVMNDVQAHCRRRDGRIVTLSFSARWSAQQQTLYVTGRDVTERNHIQDSLEQLATHDSLTGLPNRNLINRRLQEMLDGVGPDGTVAVMFVDLDRFKEVNDSMGHTLGDLLLQGVARRLAAVTRPGDVIARLGGDEFSAAARLTGDPGAAGGIAERILDIFAEPFDIEGKEVFVTASIGISIFPKDAQKKELLFQHADTAMYRAKADGRNRYRFFEEQMSHAARTRLTLEQAMRRALERQEFTLHYQPRICLSDLRVMGMEALVRWNHPDLGLIPPLEFIPIAEECGFIERIGQWVLEQACRDTALLQRDLGMRLKVSVNISAHQLKGGSLATQVDAALAASGLAPTMLELELTESALIEDLDGSVQVLTDLKCRGLSLSVDDFGTGYCGLSYLQRFPFDVLKLDRSFITAQTDDARKSAFIKAVIDLAHTLQLTVVAEGIETEEMQHRLRELGSDEGQGFLFARPMPLEELEVFLRTDRSRR